jgi:hypothetical protein
MRKSFLLDIFFITCRLSSIRNFQLCNEREPPSGLPVGRLLLLSYVPISGTSSAVFLSLSVEQSYGKKMI